MLPGRALGAVVAQVSPVAILRSYCRSFGPSAPAGANIASNFASHSRQSLHVVSLAPRGSASIIFSRRHISRFMSCLDVPHALTKRKSAGQPCSCAGLAGNRISSFASRLRIVILVLRPNPTHTSPRGSGEVMRDSSSAKRSSIESISLLRNNSSATARAEPRRIPGGLLPSSNSQRHCTALLMISLSRPLA